MAKSKTDEFKVDEFEAVPESPQEKRAVVTLAELKEQFGDKEGAAQYARVRDAIAARPQGDIFTRVESYAPDLSLHGISADTRQKVESILSDKE